MHGVIHASSLVRQKGRRKNSKKRGKQEPVHDRTHSRVGTVGTEGRSAWQDEEREPALPLPQDTEKHRQKQSEAHRRWIKKNKIGDSSGLDDDDEPETDGIYRQSGAANMVLYVGLIMIAVGMVITFVGIGDKGFKTLELKLIGPCLVGSGVFFCIVRILFCTCPYCCAKCGCCKSLARDDFDQASLLDAESLSNGHIPTQNDKTAAAAAAAATSVTVTSEKVRSAIPNYISDDEDSSGGGVGGVSSQRRKRHTGRGTLNPDPDAHRTEDDISPPSYSPYSPFPYAGPSHRRDSTVPRLPDINKSPRHELVLSPSTLLDDREMF